MRLQAKHSNRTPIEAVHPAKGEYTRYVSALTLTFVVRDAQLRREGPDRILDRLRDMARPWVTKLYDAEFGEDPIRAVCARIPASLLTDAAAYLGDSRRT